LSKMNEIEFPYKIVDKKRKPGLRAKANNHVSPTSKGG